MICPSCGTPNPSGANFCSKCGSPLAAAPPPPPPPQQPQPTNFGVGAPNEPVPQVGDPTGIIRSGDVTVRIEGELVPVVDGELGGRESIYFEHHVLLWKEPRVNISIKSLR